MLLRLSRAAYLALLAWQAAWHLALPAPLGAGLWWLALALALPLLLPLRGVLRLQRRGMAWAAYLVLLYWMGGVTEAWSSPAQRWPALLQVGLASLYLAGVLAAPWRRRV